MTFDLQSLDDLSLLAESVELECKLAQGQDGPRCQDSCRLIGFTQTEPRGRKEPCNAALLC